MGFIAGPETMEKNKIACELEGRGGGNISTEISITIEYTDFIQVFHDTYHSRG
jgi:hypothetical protein